MVDFLSSVPERKRGGRTVLLTLHFAGSPGWCVGEDSGLAHGKPIFPELAPSAPVSGVSLVPDTVCLGLLLRDHRLPFFRTDEAQVQD